MRFSTRPVLTALAATAALAAGPVSVSLAEPASITAKRQQVAALMAQLNAIGHQVEIAAEAYNGARYELQQINGRIEENHRSLARTNRTFEITRTQLASRASQIYRSRTPSVPVIVFSRGSISDAVEVVKVRSRLGISDAQIVKRVGVLRQRIKTTREALKKDRVLSRAKLAVATEQKRRIEAILRERQRVLNAAAADLRRAVAAEQARIRLQAERARQAAIAAQQAQGGGNGSGTAAAAVSAPVDLPSGSGNAEAARAALQYLGTPYKWGGARPGGFDCSGLANYVYGKIGKDVPHYTGAIWSKFPKVSSDQLQTGDLVFFSGGGHMGIYLGDGKFVHAPRTGDVVKISTMASRTGNYVGAVRP